MIVANYSARALQLAAVMPVALWRFSDAEIALWMLVETFLSLLYLADGGLTATFTRFVSAVRARSTSLLIGTRIVASKGTSRDLGIAVLASLRFTNNLVVVTGTLLLGALAALSFAGPISALTDAADGWLAFAAFVLVLPVQLATNRSIAIIQGAGELWRVHLLQTLGHVAGTVSALFALLNFDSIGVLVSAILFWRIPVWLLLARFAKQASTGKLGLEDRGAQLDKEILSALWSPTWRTAVGLTTGYTVMHGAAVVFAQVEAPAEAASVLLALRLFDAIRTIANAPFYSQLPEFARLCAAGRHRDLVDLGKARARFVAWTIVLIGLPISVLGNQVLLLFSAQVLLPSSTFIVMLAMALIVERVSTMQMQLHGASNDIIWHKANTVAAFAFAGVALVQYVVLDTFNIPLCLLLAYALVHLPYVAAAVSPHLRMYDLRFCTVALVAPVLLCAAVLVVV